MILVTGGAGYIGVVLVQQLLERGAAVRVLDKLYFGEEPLRQVRKRIDLVQGDIREFDPQVLDGVEAVVHLAGLSNDPTAEYNPKANDEMNHLGTANLARACKERGIRRFTYASSASIYDRGLYAEDLLQDEDSPVEPRAAYAVSKYLGERSLLALVDEHFCPVILRQGTVYGFSPRMRYDLVVNTFLKDALTKGELTVFCGGEMWRPLVDITDVARAHIACLEAPEEKVRGQIFNLSYRNYRILELAHYVEYALRDRVQVTINVDYAERQARSYRISSYEIERVLGFKHQVSVADSAADMLQRIEEYKLTDFGNPRYYNIQWMTLLDEMEKNLKRIGRVF
ncbi:MAG: SDR family oxidoreductase [Deinococcus sp.]|nr:SDR family oxidoreductase [Deinococcus sp.]